MEATTTTTNTSTSNRRIRSLCLAKYIKTIQQANERTAAEYEYRLSKFEKYIIASEQQQQNQELVTLDQVIDELKRSSNDKIDPYDLLSDFVSYLQQEEGIENPN